jgi:hypothetical protein
MTLDKLAFMEGSSEDVADAGMLRARVAELEEELRLRMGQVTRLDRELRHARAEVTVKDEFISVLNVEADKFQKVRDLLGRVPYGSKVAGVFEQQLRVGPDARPTLAARAKVTSSVAARRARSRAGRLKRRVMGSVRPRS